ncbi:uncharacterized protein LOC5515110 [Nematostella vectensis]|nr:uncharacterized protein LOC5515110 [Nematostella vectensis]
MLTTGSQTPALKVTLEAGQGRKGSKDDVTDRDRSPVEDAFYESFLLQSRSDVESLYASNIYWSQKHAKEVKDLDRQKMVSLTSMTKGQKDMLKKMNLLQQKQEQIQEEKRRKLVAGKANGRRTRPLSTSAMPNDHRRAEENRLRSGSMPFLDPLDLSMASRNLSKSTENLSASPGRLRVGSANKLLSRSCENISLLNREQKSPNKIILPSLDSSPVCDSINISEPSADRILSIDGSTTDEPSAADSDDESSTFITRAPAAQPPRRPRKSPNLLKPLGFDPGRRRGSLPNPAELERQLDIEKRRGSVEIEQLGADGTRAKWVPRGGRSLPPI